MRTFKLLTGLGALAVISACQGRASAISDDLKSDLALAASEQGLSLAASVGNKGQQVVSAVEQTKDAPPAPRLSRRAPPPKYTRKAPPEPAPAPAPAAAEPEQTAPQMTEEPAPEVVAEKPAEGPPAPRPQPVGNAGGVGSGSTAGSG